jgi:hypothetical protein
MVSKDRRKSRKTPVGKMSYGLELWNANHSVTTFETCAYQTAVLESHVLKGQYDIIITIKKVRSDDNINPGPVWKLDWTVQVLLC